MAQARRRGPPPPPRPGDSSSSIDLAASERMLTALSGAASQESMSSEESLAITVRPQEVAVIGDVPATRREAVAPHRDERKSARRQVASAKPLRAELERGTPVGRYIVIGIIGSGGLGQVYAAYDPQLERQVAIKVLRADLGARAKTSAARMHERLLREAQALARLSHPNVVAVHDVGTVDESIFVAMEKVEGLTLGKWRKAEDRTWKEVRDVFVQAGLGLAAAHQHGIVHRDFKPSNVIVSPDGRVRVLDFGLARATQDPPSRVDHNFVSGEQPSSSLLEADLTQVGTIMGTPAYMAPEQLRGLSTVGPAADQFAFCVALWEALYGKRPFGRAADLEERLAQIESSRIEEPEDTRNVPAWLHRALRKGLSPNPLSRHATMQTLLVQLERDRRSRRRNGALLVSVALVSALLSGGSALFFRPELTAEERGLLDELTYEARAAAAKSYFVYPPSDDPEQPTAYRKVLELEAQEGSGAREADERATELRQEFADTLVRLGDKYWGEDGGQPFAIDYYAAALMFVPDLGRARERALMTPGELALLREKASEGSFSPAELIAAEPLNVLAEPDESERTRKLSELYARQDTSSSTTTARLDRVLKKRRPAAVATPKPADPVPQPAPEPEQVAVVVEPPREEPPPSPKLKTADPKQVAQGLKREQRDLAASLSEEGKDAFRGGQFDRAETLYHRALSHDGGHSSALAGLSEIYFERGAYPKALKYAKLAVAASPKRGDYRITLGDAYFKVHAYENARQAYEEAQKLGDKRAGQRLAQLTARIGKD